MHLLKQIYVTRSVTFVRLSKRRVQNFANFLYGYEEFDGLLPHQHLANFPSAGSEEDIRWVYQGAQPE
jgi:hypothetical protein